MTLSGRIDLHSHLLPRVDDGCTDLDNALSTARQYADSGYTTVIVTPHNIHGTAWSKSPETVQRLTDELQLEITKHQIPLTLQAGMEIAFSDLFWLHFQQGRFLPLGKSNAYLVEFSMQESGRKEIELFLNGLSAGEGCTFIVAHPERCAAFQEDPRNLQVLLDSGCLVQLNFGSILGWYGRKAQNTAQLIVINRMCHLIATDCHGHSKRTVPGSVHFKELEELIGQENVVMTLRDNPLHILNNGDVFPIKLTNKRINSVIENNQRKNDCPKNNGGTILTRMVNFFRSNLD